MESISEQEIRRIVEKVVSNVLNSDNQTINAPGIITSTSSRKIADGIYTDINEAIEKANYAQKQLTAAGLAKRKQIIAAIRKISSDNAAMLAKMAVKETGLGRIEDKIAKNLLCAEKTPGVEDLEPEIVSGDHGLTLTELAPWGVIGSITPSTNPAATIINNSISMLAAGNTVVFNPHPSAKNVSNKAVELVNQASQSVGGPEEIAFSIAEPSIESANTLFNHNGIHLLCVTGGGEVVRAAMRSNKRVIAAGPGNPPVVVDETADIAKAAYDIVYGASFDNNVVCILEKEIIAVDSIADKLKSYMLQNNVYELKGEQINKVLNTVTIYKSEKSYPYAVNRKFVGKAPIVIAQAAGINIPSSTRLLLAETDKNHPFAQLELLMPVIPLIRVSNVDEAINLAVELEHNFKHTAIMHSKNLDNLHRMAVAIGTSIFVKNGPSLAGLGVGGEGWTSMTISTPTGEGVTSARTFVRKRRCVLVDYFRIV